MISFKRRRQRRHTEMPEICLTPLIDTALTLLVIFMVTTPMIQNSIKINLPEGHAQEAGSLQEHDLVVTIDKDEKLYINNLPTTLGHLAADMKKKLETFKTKPRVWIAADKSKTCSAEALIQVIDVIKKLEGIKDVAIPTKKPLTA
jgi:biopolymer transport protein ExbD